MSGGGTTIRRARRVASAVVARPDSTAIAFLVVIATVLFTAPVFNGSLVLPGDDLFQNEPLRVLTGSIIRSGRLPAWDPLIWSGTPLLAGWNAGSMFPGTWLFAIAPVGFAWTANLVIAYATCSTGTYLLLRRIGVQAIASFAAALVFTYTGFMNGQVVHIGLIQGTAFLPWMLLAIEMMAESKDTRQKMTAVALFGSATSLTVLAGDPRSATSAAIVAVIWIAARVFRGLGNSRRFFSHLAAGGVLGIALSAIQWIPGIGFLHASQRANAAYSLFSAGSLGYRSITSNLLVPFLIGGNGNFGVPTYSGSYNLPEVTIGAGLVALVGFGAYLPIAFASVRGWLSARERRGGHRLGTAYTLVAVGVLLTLGANTPLEHLLVHLPLFGGERLQNRNAVIFDFGLALFVAFLLDDLVARKNPSVDDPETSPEPPVKRPRVLETASSVAFGAVAPFAAVALIVLAYLDPVALSHQLGVSGNRPKFFIGFDRYLVPSVLLAAALGIFVLVVRRLPLRMRGKGALVFVAIDLGIYLTGMGLITVPTSSLAATSPTSTALARLAGPGGRTALFNSSFYGFGNDPLVAEEIGVTDLNLLRDIPSVQGYGSIVNSGYQDATQTHYFEDINLAALDSTTFDDLNLTTLLTLPQYLDIEIPPRAGVPVATDHGEFTAGPTVAAPPYQFSGPYPVSPEMSANFLLSQPFPIDHVTFFLNTVDSGPRRIEATAVAPDGSRVTRSGSLRGSSITVAFPNKTVAVRFEVRVLAGLPGEIGAVVAVTRGHPERLLLDGAMQNSLDAPQWTYAGTIGPFTAFTNHRARGGAWLEPLAGRRSTDGGSVRIVSRSNTAPTIMSVSSPRGAILVRSEEYAHGWTARLRPVDGGPTIILPVGQNGLIEQVMIPPGKFTVTWRYAPTGLLVGLVFSGFGGATLLGIVVVSIRRRRGIGTVGTRARWSTSASQ
jgi:hypothetical protein